MRVGGLDIAGNVISNSDEKYGLHTPNRTAGLREAITLVGTAINLFVSIYFISVNCSHFNHRSLLLHNFMCTVPAQAQDVTQEMEVTKQQLI